MITLLEPMFEIQKLKQQATALMGNLKQAEKSNPPDTPFIHKFSEFYDKAEPLIEQTERKLQDTRKFFQNVRRLGDDGFSLFVFKQ